MDPQRRPSWLPFFPAECAVAAHSRPTLAPIVIINFLLVAGVALSIVVAIASSYEGARLMSLQGIHRRAFLLLLLGVSICGIGGAINYTKYHLVTASLQALEVSAVPKDLPPQNQWNAALTAIERERMGVLIARDAYLHSGRIVTYIDQSQLTKVFVPTQEDIQKRESTVSGVAELRQLASGRFTDSILWLSWFVLALLLGFSHAQVSKSNGR